jgi:xylulokinase
MKAFAGIDIGTQGTKAALFEEGGRLLASSFRASVLHQPVPGVVEEDPDRQLATVCQTLRECVGKARLKDTEVAAIAISGQMAGVVGVGKTGRAVTPYDSWLDRRCAPYIPRMDGTAGERILALTGGPVSFNHGPRILWWMHERPRVFRSITAFVQPAGYAAMRLAGLTTGFIDRTYLHFSGFADNRAGSWDSGLCEAFRLDPEKLPRIVGSSDIVGEITPRMARRCGVRAGVPIVAGCGDSAASFLACGATREGICVDVAGTASVFASVARSFRPDRSQKILSCGQSATPGLWHPYAYINGGGMNLEWFRRLIQVTGTARADRISFEMLDRQATRLAAKVDLPIFVPHLSGRVAPAWPKLRGAWVNLQRTHEVGHLWRAILEAVALEYAIYKGALGKLHPTLPLKELRVTGGGERSALWNQLKADVLGVKVVQIAHCGGSAAGAALLAAHGVGAVQNLDTGAHRWLLTGRITRPNRRLAAHYASRLTRYQGLLSALNG